MSLNNLSTGELIMDYQESVYDASVCRAAIRNDILYDSHGDSVRERMRDNYTIMLRIVKELNQRGVDILAIKKIVYPATFYYENKGMNSWTK